MKTVIDEDGRKWALVINNGVPVGDALNHIASNERLVVYENGDRRKSLDGNYEHSITENTEHGAFVHQSVGVWGPLS